MEPRKLSEEEASRLFEATFLLISQQNLAQKQRQLKIRNSPHTPTVTEHPLSPLKMHQSPKEHPTPEGDDLPRLPNPENSPEKVREEMSKKWSMEKSSSNSEGLDPEVRSRFDLQQKEEDSDHRSPLPASPTHPQHIHSQACLPSPQQHSQMQEEAHEDLYVESMIKELKRDLEIRSRGKICKSQEVNSKTGQVTGYNFYCKTNPNCPFSCTLDYTGNRNAKNQKLYKLVYECDTHAKGCLEEEEEVAFMRLTKTIDHLEPAIVTLLTRNPDLKPKQILSEMAKQVGEQSHRFIYSGLSSKSYHKAAKKYFDNMIYKIKSQMGML